MIKSFFENSTYTMKSHFESFKEFRIKAQNSNYDFNELIKLLETLDSISERDGFELTIEANGNNISVLKGFSKTNLKAFFDDNSSDFFDIELIITKSISSKRLSIYCLDFFEEFIAGLSLIDLLKNVEKVFNETLCFEVFHDVSGFGSSTIKFCSYKKLEELNGYEERSKKLEALSEYSNLIDNTTCFPIDFYMQKSSDQFQSINNSFSNLSKALSLSVLANSFKIDENNRVSYKVNGYKAIEVSNKKIEDLNYENSLLIKIFNWVIDSGQCGDKLGLIRNIFSLHITNEGLVDINNKTWNAIQSNYEIYLKNNIQQYIEIKNKLTDFIFEYNTKVYDLSDQFLSSFRSNLAAIFGFIISIVIINGVKGTGIRLIFSNEYILLVIAIAILSLIWMFFVKKDMSDRALNSEKNVKSVLTRNYQNVLIEDEIDSYITPALNESKKYLKAQSKKYVCLWTIILVLFVIVFVYGNYKFVANESIAQTKDSAADLNDRKFKNNEKEPVSNSKQKNPNN